VAARLNTISQVQQLQRANSPLQAKIFTGEVPLEADFFG